MAALDDLKASVVALVTAATNEIAAIVAKLGSLGDTVSASDVEAAVAQLNAVTDQLNAETAALAPPPPPTT